MYFAPCVPFPVKVQTELRKHMVDRAETLYNLGTVLNAIKCHKRLLKIISPLKHWQKNQEKEWIRNL